MLNQAHRRRVVCLAAGLLVCAGLAPIPARAQGFPIIIPPPAPVVIGVTIPVPPVVIVAPGDDRGGGIRGESTGHADVDVDVDRHQEDGQAIVR